MIYLAFNKPFNVLSQFKPLDNKATLKDYIQLPEKPKAVGRLDYDSEGLILLSNDEDFIWEATNPKLGIQKEYYTQVEKIPTETDLDKFKEGIQTQTEYYKPCKYRIIEEPDFLWERIPPIRVRKSIPTSWISLIITEGKNRQVRKMTAFIGFPALRLIRVRIGSIKLDGLMPGEYKKIDPNLIFRNG